jgi:hypothetical protein
MTELLLVRHGEPSWNAAERMQAATVPKPACRVHPQKGIVAGLRM